jgi:hypothetical protein
VPAPRRPLSPEQALIRLYRAEAQRLRIQLRSALASEAIGTAVYRKRQLEEVRRQLAALGQRTRATPIELVAAGYDRGARIVDIAASRPVMTGYAFSGVHQRPAMVIADNIASRIEGARQLVGRRVEDVFRQAGLEAIGQGIIGGEARRETSKALVERLVKEGVTGFVDARGAQWQLDTYAEMAVRTTTREAVSAGTANRMRETGQQLITISYHATRCEICGPYEGNTYALPGEEVDGYDTIDQLPPFHPNCLHVATPAGANIDALLAELGVSR